MRSILLSTVLLMGCTDGWWNEDDTDTDTDTDRVIVDDGCPTGLQKAEFAQVFFGQFLLDSVGISVTFNPTAEHNGQPAACISDSQVQLLTFLGEDPFAWITFEPRPAGGYEVGGTGVFTVVDIIGTNNPTLFANSDFVSGSWTIFESTGTQTGQVNNAYAVNNLHNIIFNMNYELQP